MDVVQSLMGVVQRYNELFCKLPFYNHGALVKIGSKFLQLPSHSPLHLMTGHFWLSLLWTFLFSYPPISLISMDIWYLCCLFKVESWKIFFFLNLFSGIERLKVSFFIYIGMFVGFVLWFFLWNEVLIFFFFFFFFFLFLCYISLSVYPLLSYFFYKLIHEFFVQGGGLKDIFFVLIFRP